MSQSCYNADLPRRCGRYVLVARVGGGGMAEVYKARLAQTEGPERELVIKLLPPGADPAAAARFIDEAKIALPLTHGNITTTFEFGRDQDRPFLVMEYVHGRSLRELIDALAERGETVSLPTSLYVAREVTRALRYAHTFVDVEGALKPVIHRDVSPENVLISFAGQVKLTDFGIARSSEALDLGGAWGKPTYVAPEILTGDPGGPSSDLYSLGCVLYEMLTGWPPLMGKSEEETLRLVREQPPVPLRHLRDDAPEILDRLITDLLAKTPEARDVDVARLEVTLSQLLNSAAPHFTDADLAATLQKLFQPQRSSGESDEQLLASRLRGQLEEAGVNTSGRESAAEMLALGTVQLSPAPSDPFEEKSAIEPTGGEGADTTLKVATQKGDTRSAGPWRAIAAILLLLLLVLGFSTVAYLGWFSESGTSSADAGLATMSNTADAGERALPDARTPRSNETRSDANVTDDGDASPTASETGSRRDAGAGADADRRSKNHIRRRRPATVTFNSHPWSFVYVGGRKLPGHTPIRNVSLPPGRYRVRFVNPDLNLSKSTTIVLAPGQSRFVKARLSPRSSGSE